jgi:predicted outer membrane repeat protein
MRLLSWLRQRPAFLPERATFRPRLEGLEDRWVPSTLTVQNNLDSGAGSLRAEIAAAHNGDTIAFAPSLVGQTITLTSGEMLLKHNVTITGPGAAQLTVSGNHASRIFELASTTKPTVILSGLSICNGNGAFAAGFSHTNDGSGGAILNEGTLTISNCTLSGNSAPQGGAIHNDATLTVSNSTLSGNSANVGPAGAGYGGAIQSFVTLTVSGCTFSGNTANQDGGAIVCAGTATISGSTFSGNISDNGGAIDNEGTMRVSGCNISNNMSTFDGGGISNYGSLTVTGSTLTGNSAAFKGGGIFNGGSAATVTVKNSSTITGNYAPSGTFEDIYNYGVMYWDGTGTLGIVHGGPVLPSP